MRRLLTFLPVLGLLVAFLPVNSANAQVPTSSIEATVAGTTSDGSHCIMGESLDPDRPVCDPTVTGTFDGVVLTGLFTAADGTDAASCFAEVEITGTGNVTFTEDNEILASNGTLEPADFEGGTDVAGVATCEVQGSIANGSYVRVGSVAVAYIDVHFTVRTWIDGVHLEVTGWLKVKATVSAIPGAGDDVGDPGSSQVEGVVVGQCPPSQTSPTTPCAA